MYDEPMRRAIALAAAAPRPHPNPRVGAVVLDAAGNIVAEAAHLGAGMVHAEADAVRLAGERARGGTVVVTLEPCDHHGRTGPCTEALLEAGVARVVVGAEDPDPRVRGRGIRRLRDAGIAVLTGVLAGNVEALDPGYFHHRRTGRPRVTLKWAATLDGQTAAADGTSQWITSPEARADAHRLRAAADVVMVGAGTVLVDDPRLDVRLDGWDGAQPRPVVVAGRRPLPHDARIFARKTLVYATEPLALPAEVVVVPPRTGGADLAAVLGDLGERGMLDVLVEGGPALAGALWRAGLVDHAVLYLGAKVGGGMGRPAFTAPFETLADARPVEVTGIAKVGPDVRIELEPA